MPDTFDLDTAFDTLATEVGGRTAAPGAGQAITTARRRRTTIAASAAVALIAIGGVVTTQLAGGGDKISPTGELPVPAPAPLDGAALDTASHGWVTGWHRATRDDVDTLDQMDQNIWQCLDYAPDNPGTDDPKRFGNQLFVGGDHQIAMTVFRDFSNKPRAVDTLVAQMGDTFASCAGGGATVTTYGDGGQVTYYAMAGSEHGQQAWVGRLGDRMVMFVVGGATGAPGQESVKDVGTAVLAAVQEDSSYSIDPAMTAGSGEESSGYASAGASAVAHPVVNESELRDALDGWPGSAAGGNATSHQLPCLSSPGKAQSGSGQSVGTTGEMAFHDFASRADAEQGVQQLIQDLASCETANWTLDLETLPGGIVAWYTDGVVWIAQQGKTIGVLTLSEATDPPAAVRVAVGKVVAAAVS